jgi:hypothetical protein
MFFPEPKRRFRPDDFGFPGPKVPVNRPGMVYRASASLPEVFTCSWGPIEAVFPIYGIAVIQESDRVGSNEGGKRPDQMTSEGTAALKSPE